MTLVYGYWMRQSQESGVCRGAYGSQVATAGLLVRKLGVPGNEELAMGAIACGGVQVLNDHVLQYLEVSWQAIEEVARREKAELQRRGHGLQDADNGSVTKIHRFSVQVHWNIVPVHHASFPNKSANQRGDTARSSSPLRP